MRENQIVVGAQDFGIGIPVDKRQQMFQRFYRVSGAMYDTIPGIGLGLSISAEIIKRHGGTCGWRASLSRDQHPISAYPLVREQEQASDFTTEKEPQHD